MGETDDKEKGKAAGTSPLQWIKDLQDKQEEAANEHADAINAAGDAYQQGYAQRSAELKESLDSANETARQAGITYADLVQTWIDAAQNEANAQRKRNEAQDQSELDTILSTVKRKFVSSDRAVLVLCEATKDYPWRTIRSKINGARLFIEMNGQWREPEYALPTEQILADYPLLTREKLDEMEEAFGF